MLLPHYTSWHLQFLTSIKPNKATPLCFSPLFSPLASGHLRHCCICKASGTAPKIACNKFEGKLEVGPGSEPETVESDKKPEEGEGQDEGDGISGIRVPRQQYIGVSKSELLEAIMLLLMFDSSPDETDQFLLLSSCLDSVLHAEHKTILEEMRVDYDLTQFMDNKGVIREGFTGSETSFASNSEELDFAAGVNGAESKVNSVGDKNVTDNSLPFGPVFYLRNLLGSSPRNSKGFSKESRVAVATRFQRAFVQLLYNAQFEELSATDLTLTSALNTDYLLTLPIYIDWKQASESNAIIFRRGYTAERQKGLLIVEKLDYLQSKLLRGLFSIMSEPLKRVGVWLTEAFESTSQGQDAKIFAKRVKLWLKELPIFQRLHSSDQTISDNLLGVNHLSDTGDLPIWLAAQRAVTRYEGILSPVGPRGRLLRRLLTWIGLIPSTPKQPFGIDSDIGASEPYLRPIFLSRISLGDIWKPATRKYCGNDLWKMLKTAISILLSQSVLQEPAFKELILLYTEDPGDGESGDKVAIPSLKLKIYENIPIPDLPVIFPHKKLSFRILDTVRLDIATILGLLAYFINYKFEDILSSPSAILLDVIAVSALIIYVTRVALGYKQTWDRYQLLVNRTLYEKTLASGFGSVHFLLDASEQQQYKEAILAYAILLKAENGQITCAKSVGDKCQRFMYHVFKEKVEMPIEKAISTLVRLGLVTQHATSGKVGLQAVPCVEAYENLKQLWDDFLR